MKKFFLTMLAVVFSLAAYAQSAEITNVHSAYMQAMNAITENNQVIGYYAFYYMDKASKKDDIYTLQIFDNNFQQTHQIEVQMPESKLMESSFNGDRFCFSFINIQGKSLSYVLYDKEGKKTGTYKVSGLSRTELALIQQNLAYSDESGEGMMSGGLIAVAHKGFVRYGLDKDKGYHVVIEMFDNSGRKKWSTTSGVPAGEKSYEAAYPFFSSEKVVASYVITRPNLLSTKDMKNFIIFTDVETGKVSFRLDSKGKKYLESPIGTSYDQGKNEYFVYGEYFKPGDNIVKDKSTGLYFTMLDSTGKVKQESYSSWATDVAKATKMDNGKFEDNTYVTIHKMIRTSDGNIYAIGEQFKKTADAAGIALQVINKGNAGVAAVKIQLHDMMVFEYGSDLKLKKVDVLDKAVSNVHLPQGMGLYGPTTLAFFLKLYHAFDYAFTTVTRDNSNFNSTYINYDKEKGESSDYVIGNIFLAKSSREITVDKIRLNDKPTASVICPAKPGYIGVMEYFKKDKRLYMYLEKINN